MPTAAASVALLNSTLVHSICTNAFVWFFDATTAARTQRQDIPLVPEHSFQQPCLNHVALYVSNH